MGYPGAGGIEPEGFVLDSAGSAVMAEGLTFPVRRVAGVPARREPSFQVRRRAAADIPPLMVGRTRFEAYRTPLLQFISDWNGSSTKANLIEEAPSYRGSDRFLLPSLASVVHALVDRHSMSVPDWVWAHCLDEEWVLFCDSEEVGSFFCERALREAPSTCVHHRVFFHHRLLDKGTPDWWLPWIGLLSGSSNCSLRSMPNLFGFYPPLRVT